MVQNGSEKIKMAAVQLEVKIGDVEANLATCENLVNDAASKGAKWIILPEFFTTGMAFDSQIVAGIQAHDGGKALELLSDLAKKYTAYVGGSFLIRDKDEIVRNAFFLVSPEGVLGRHNKDIPTMWEHCFFKGDQDDGIIETTDGTIGLAVCWEFMRSQTAKRLREKVDIVVGGNCWWSVPLWHPKSLTEKWERNNEKTSYECVRTFATYVGAPIVHGAHVGSFTCSLPATPLQYNGHFEGGAIIVDAEGQVLAFRDRRKGQGFALADVTIGRTKPKQEIPSAYWLHRRGVIPGIAWTYQRWHGKHWYRKNVAKPSTLS